MKKTSKVIIVILTILMFIFFAYSYFNVKGSEIKDVSNITEAKSVSMIKNYSTTPEITEEFTLDSEQMERLKELILDSNFTKLLLPSVSNSDKDEYFIVIRFDDYGNDLRIDSIGNEYISFPYQINGWLRINNPDWHKTLEKIIKKSY
nr:hypothetical protein [Tissierella sp.]